MPKGLCSTGAPGSTRTPSRGLTKGKRPFGDLFIFFRVLKQIQDDSKLRCLKWYGASSPVVGTCLAGYGFFFLDRDLRSRLDDGGNWKAAPL